MKMCLDEAVSTLEILIPREEILLRDVEAIAVILAEIERLRADSETAQKMVRADRKLVALEVQRLQGELDQYNEAAQFAARGGHANERHCTCVGLLRTMNAKLLAALMKLKNGDCWCDRYYDPVCGHQKRCDQARSAFEAAEAKGE